MTAARWANRKLKGAPGPCGGMSTPLDEDTRVALGDAIRSSGADACRRRALWISRCISPVCYLPLYLPWISRCISTVSPAVSPLYLPLYLAVPMAGAFVKVVAPRGGGLMTAHGGVTAAAGRFPIASQVPQHRLPNMAVTATATTWCAR